MFYKYKLHLFSIFFLSSDRPKIPEIDIAFALGADSLRSSINFQSMKDIIKEIVNEYGSYKFNYAVVAFGDDPSVRLRFDSKFPSDTDLNRAIERIPKSFGGLSLDKGLQKSQDLLNTGRSKARKVLVVVIDKRSDSSLNDLKESAKTLEEDGIRVIPIAFGNDGDVREVGELTPIKDDVLSTRDGDKPKDVAKKIMDRILNGEFQGSILHLQKNNFFIS